MNIYDISKKSNVSIATVSRVLNGSIHVSPATRKKVLKVIEQSGYKPNAFARGLGLDSMKTIGILCVDIDDYYFTEAIYYVVKNIRENGYDSILIFTGSSLENKIKNLESLLTKRVDGVVLLGSSYVESKNEDNQYIRDAAKKIPIVMMNGYVEGENISCCLSDDYQAMFDVTSKLIEDDQKNIIYLYRNLNYSAEQKLKGFEDALLHHKKNIRDYIQKTSGDLYDVKKTLEKIKEKNIPFTSIICADDEIAVGALKYALTNKVKVPEELRIIGYNNSKLSLCTNPEISSIDPNIKDLSFLSVKVLMDAINGEIVPKKSLVETRLMERETN